MKIKSKKFYIIAIIGAVILTSIFFVKIKTNNYVKQANSMNNLTYEVSKGNIERYVSKNGNIQSSLIKELKVQDDSVVTSVHINEGQKVRKGDLLIELDTNSDSTNDISQYSLDIMEYENAIDDLNEKIENLNIRSPYNGVVSEIYANEGEEVIENSRFIKLINKDVLEADIPFAQFVAKDLKIGQEVEILLTKSLLTLKGKITSISDDYGSDAGAVLCDVTVELNNTGSLTQGTTVSASIKSNNKVYKSYKNSELKWKELKDITFKASGTLDDIIVKKGESIKKGELLGKLSNEDYKKDLNIKSKTLQNKRKDLNKRINYSYIYAPITGTIVNVDVVSEENVSSQQVVAKIADLDNLEITVPIDELDIASIKEGEDAVINVSAIKNKEFKGKVTKISHEGKVENGIASYSVSVRLEKNDLLDKLRLGMSANVKLLLGSRENVLIVPVDYLIKEDGKYFVNISKNNGESQRVEVEVGLVNNNDAEILTNIKEGDILVKENTFFMGDI